MLIPDQTRKFRAHPRSREIHGLDFQPIPTQGVSHLLGHDEIDAPGRLGRIRHRLHEGDLSRHLRGGRIEAHDIRQPAHYQLAFFKPMRAGYDPGSGRRAHPIRRRPLDPLQRAHATPLGADPMGSLKRTVRYGRGIPQSDPGQRLPLSGNQFPQGMAIPFRNAIPRARSGRWGHANHGSGVITSSGRCVW